MRCWVIVPAVALLVLASVGRSDAVRPQGRKIVARVEESSPVEEHRSVEAAPAGDYEEVPDRAAATSDPAAVVSPAAEADSVDVATTLDPHMMAARQVSRALKFALKPEVSITYLPTINYRGLSLSLTNVRILGLDKYHIKPTHIFGPDKSGQIEFEKLTLLADPYIAGGRLLNLPFVGEGLFNTTVLRLRIHVQFHREPFTTYCPTPNSTVFHFSLQRLIVKFENLNPGSETGELINAMISGYGHDMMAWLTSACNNETLLHPIADKIAVDIISNGCDYAANTFDSEAGSRKTVKVLSEENSKSCNGNFEKVEDSSTSSRGDIETDLQGSEKEELSSPSARGDNETDLQGSEKEELSSPSARGDNETDLQGSEKEELSSPSARGDNETDLQGSENIEESVNEMIQLFVAALADPLAEIFEKSF